MQININTYIIEYHSTRGDLRKLAAFIFFKNVYQNNTFYKFNYANAGKKTGIGRYKVKSNIDFFVNEGWCDWINGDLYFHRLEDTVEEQIKKYTLNYNFNGSINDIYYQLVALLFKRKKEQHDWLWKIRNNGKKGPLNMWGVPAPTYETFDFFLSYTRAGSLLGRSAATAYRVLKELAKVGLVQIKRLSLGFLRKYVKTVRDGHLQATNLKNAKIMGMPVFRERPKKSNPVDYSLYSFPNAYSFENVVK